MRFRLHTDDSMTYETDIDALFREASVARQLEQSKAGFDGCDSACDMNALFENPRCEVRHGTVTFHALPDGDIHVCYGSACRYATPTSENALVCQISGQVVGIHAWSASDASWTGRSCASANPDETSSGTPTGGWMKKRDAFAASVAAYEMAKNLSGAVDDVAAPVVTRRRKVAEVKRGALCVDEENANEHVEKKSRIARKDGFSRETIMKLESEAQVVLCKLLARTESDSADSAAPAPVVVPSPAPPTPAEKGVGDDACAPPPPKLDPRLQNVEFVRTLALRRYVRACADGMEPYNLDGVQNVFIAVNKFVKQQREAADEQLEAAKRVACSEQVVVLTGKLKYELAALIVTLWRAACATEYLQKDKKSSDSFRPFASGVLYSLKRGVYLQNGTCIIPEIPSLVSCLPALRSNNASASARQLQSSSHRGVCCLQRALASLAEMSTEKRQVAVRLLEDASRQCVVLQKLFLN